MPRSAHAPNTRLWPRVLLTVVFAGLFTVLVWRTLVVHGAPFQMDRALHAWTLAHRPSWTAHLAVAVTLTGSGVPAYALAAFAGAVGVHTTHRWRGALLGLLALASAQLPRAVVAAAVARPRPPTTDWAWQATGWAMPSGHATTSAVVAVLLTATVLRTTSGRWRSRLVALPALWALAVGASRVHLGVHWSTDVLGGWLLAACWAGTASVVVVLLRRRNSGAVVPEERQRT